MENEFFYFGKHKELGIYMSSTETDFFDEYVEVPVEEMHEINRESCKTGKILSADENGYPVLLDLPQPKKEDLDKEVYRNELEELQKYLQDTDWYAIRFSETGKKVPKDISEKRENARNRISELRLLID